MPEATKKSHAINSFISNIMGRDRQSTIRKGQCMTCGGDAVAFRDELSLKEFTISGMCQKCQDSIFG